MPKLTVDGTGEFEVPAGKRLILALTDEARVDQLHACGGNARCTTCRVEFERAVLAAKGLTAVRLSCQILCEHDMSVRCISRLAGSGRVDAGKRPEEAITPPPVWTPK
jgi:ferredoxin